MISSNVPLLFLHPDEESLAFQKKENNNNCNILVLNYITQNCNIIKIRVKFKIILNGKICIELYYYAL